MANDVVGKLIFQVDVDEKEAKKSLDSFSDSVKEAEQNTKDADSGIGSSFDNISAKSVLMATAVGTAFLKLSKDFIQAVGEIQNGQKNIVNATGASGETLEGLMQSAKNVYTQTEESFDDVSRAIGEINTRLGQTGKELENTTGLFLDFADATGQDVQQSVVKVTQVMNRWGIELENMPSLLDKLTLAGQQSGISVDSLEASLSANAGTLQAMGYSIDEAIALMMKLEEQGIDSSSVIMGMKKSFEESAKAGTNARDDWETLMNSIANATTEAEANELAIEAFGNRIATDMVIALRNGSLNIDGFTESLKNAEGTLESTTEAGMTTAEKIDTFKNKITVLEGALGEVFAPAVEGVIGLLGDMVDGFLDLDTGTQTLIVSLGMFAGALALGGPVGIALGLLGALLLAFQNNESAVKDLDSAMGGLRSAMDNYKNLVDKLAGSVDTLTDSEKALLEVQIRKASIEIAEQLKEVAKTFSDVKKEADEATLAYETQEGRLKALDTMIASLAKGSLTDIQNELDNLSEKSEAGVLTSTEKEIKALYENYLPDLQSAFKSGSEEMENWLDVLAEYREEVYADFIATGDEAIKVNTAMEATLRELALAVENGSLDLERYRKLYPELVSDIEQYISKSETAIIGTDGMSESAGEASASVEELAGKVEEAGDTVAGATDSIEESSASLDDTVGQLTDTEADHEEQLLAIATGMKDLLPVIDDFIGKMEASAGIAQGLTSAIDGTADAVARLASEIESVNKLSISVPSKTYDVVSQTVETVSDYTEAMDRGQIGSLLSGDSSTSPDMVASRLLASGEAVTSPVLNLNNNLTTVLEIDGTQLGIATLKNIDSASQFVI